MVQRSYADGKEGAQTSQVTNVCLCAEGEKYIETVKEETRSHEKCGGGDGERDIIDEDSGCIVGKVAEMMGLRAIYKNRRDTQVEEKNTAVGEAA